MFNDLRGTMNNGEIQQKAPAISKNEEVLRSKIPIILKNYEQLKEWSDLGQWLLKLQQIFQTYPSQVIPKKKLLCKRLAQCLSPIWNKAIHENALVIYDLMLSNLTQNPNYNLIVDLPLFSLGLFPFFGFASIQCKPMFLSLLEKYYYPLGKELLPSIGGLINSIIVGMEETNEEMMKKVMQSLDTACDSVGIKSFFGLMWTSILRSSRCRLGAYKYLMKRWGKSQSLDNDDSIDEEKMPNKSALVLNALLASLEDESPLVKRSALDFMCAHCKIQDKVFQPGEYLVLIEGCLLLFVKLDHAVVRRVNNWLFGEEEINEEMEVIPIIQEALKRVLCEDQSDPLKIIQNWYMQHPETVKMTLNQIGYQLVKYIFHRPQLEKASERLVESIASHGELVMRSLYESLKKLMKEQKQEQCKEVISYIDYALNKLMKLQFESVGKIEDYNQFASRTECIQELIVIILEEQMQYSVEQLIEASISESVFDLVLDCINKIRERFEHLDQEKIAQSVLIQANNEVPQQDLKIIMQYSDYYVKFSEYVIQASDDRLYDLSSKILLKLQIYVMKHGGINYVEIPNWVQQLFNSFHGTSLQSLCSIQIIVELLKHANDNENTRSLANMLTKNSFRDIYQLDPLQTLGSFELQPSGEGPNYIKAIFERLYSLIDYNYHDNQIVEQLLYLSKKFQHVSIFVIEQSLIRDQDQNRYQIYCRITNSYYKKNPKLVIGVGVLMMLNYLEHENPLLRYNSRTWLGESAHSYFRILDPLIIRLQSLQKQDMKTNLVADTLKKIQLLYSVKEWVVPYLQTVKPTYSQESTYLEIIAQTLIEYVITMNNSESARINAISAECFEHMLNNITQQQFKISIIKMYLHVVLTKLQEVIQNEDPVLQIQMLNLLKVFVLSIKEVQDSLHVQERHTLIDVLQSNLFFLNLMTGLRQSKVFYLKSRYLNIIVISIYSLSDILPPKILTEKVSLIFTNLLTLLKGCQYNVNQQQHYRQRRTLVIDYIKTHHKSLPNQFEILSDNILTQDHTAKMNGSGELFEEVMSFSNAIRAIMSYFFKFKYEIKDIETRPNVAGILVDILTFNIWKQKNEKSQNPQQPQQPTFLQFQDTCQMLLKLFPGILSAFLECWRLQFYWNILSTKGCIVYEYSQFEEFDKQLKEQLSKSEEDYTDEDQIKQSILQLITPCAYQFMSQLLSSFLNIWQNEYSTNFYAEPKSNPNMCKLMELAITLQLPADEFMLAFLNTTQVVQIMQYYQKRPCKKGIYLFNYDQATFENGILFFLYTYFATCQFKGLKPQQLIKLWNYFLLLSKSLLQSRHINTICFLLEIFHMLSWKFSPKEVLAEFRKELHTQIRNTLNILSEIASSLNKYITISVQSTERYSVSNQDVNLQLIVPFPPVIYEMYQEYLESLSTEGERTEELRNQFWIQRTLFDPYKQKGLKLDEEDFTKKCSLIAMKTLKKLAYITLINTYEASRNERILENTRDFMTNIFPLMEKKDNGLLLEGASELLYTLLKSSKDQLPQAFRISILEIFNGQEFFKCSGRTLKYWTEIVDMISEKGDLLLEQLGNNQNFFQGFAGLFTSKNAETMKKIKGFERVCFIIYSGGVDKYQSKLSNLLDAILTVIKDIRQQHDAITVLIIFCIRILVLRLSPQSLQQVFRRIWPYLVSMLMQIFDRKGKQANIHILLAGLKLIELFTLFQLEEFYFYEWIFVFDYFGMTINMQLQNEVIGGVRAAIQSPYKFIPYMSYQFPNTQNFSVDYENKLYADQLQLSLFKKKRLVKIKDIQYSSEVELRQEAVYLCQYLIDINQQRVEVSHQNLEALIEAEFISLDDYISIIQ